MNPILFSILQTILIVALAPLLIGIIRTMKARFQNRRGASVSQPYWALLALCKKEMTITRHSSWVFRVVPFVVLGSALMLAALLPTLGIGGWASGQGSIFLIGGVMAIGSVFLVFGGMDVASAFGGMGADREMTLAALVEPAIIIVLATFGMVAKYWTTDTILGAFVHAPWYISSPFLLFTFIAFGFVILAEDARYPMDNPATHLELTMVHEAMILEYSGPYLAMLELASAIKLAVLSVFFFDLLTPFVAVASDASTYLWGFGLLLARLIVAGILVAFLETVLVKMRFTRMQEYMAIAYFLGLAGLVLTLAF